MAGKLCRDGHNFAEPLFIALAVLRIEQMADDQGHRFCCAMKSSGEWRDVPPLAIMTIHKIIHAASRRQAGTSRELT
jgi:hypothetical protein